MVEAATFHADASADLVQNEAAAAYLKPERVSPMVTVLTHPTCPVTGQILCSWGGWFGRFGVSVNRGWAKKGAEATADDLVENWERVVDEASARDAGLDSFNQQG